MVIKALSARSAAAKDTTTLLADLAVALESAPIGIRRLVFSACTSAAADPTRSGEWALSGAVLTVDPSGFALDTIFATMLSLGSVSPFTFAGGGSVGMMSLASTTALASAARRYFLERGKRFGPAAPLLAAGSGSASPLVVASDAVTARAGTLVRSTYNDSMQDGANAIRAAAAPHLLPGQALSIAFHSTAGSAGSTIRGPTSAPSFFTSASGDADGLVAGLLRRCLHTAVDGAGIFSAPTRHAYADKKKGWSRPCGSDRCTAWANAAGGFSWIDAFDSSSGDDADVDGSDADLADISAWSNTAAAATAAVASSMTAGSATARRSLGATAGTTAAKSIRETAVGGFAAAAACFSEATIRYPSNASLTVAGEGASSVEWRRERDAARAAALPLAAKQLKETQRSRGAVAVRAADLDAKVLISKRGEQRAAQRKQFRADKGGMGVPGRTFGVCFAAAGEPVVLSLPADGSSPAHLHRYATSLL
jgi:hypothetical protein